MNSAYPCPKKQRHAPRCESIGSVASSTSMDSFGSLYLHEKPRWPRLHQDYTYKTRGNTTSNSSKPGTKLGRIRMSQVTGKTAARFLQNDMSNPQNFKTVEEQLDLTSLMDYMIANPSVVSSDWMNTTQAGGFESPTSLSKNGHTSCWDNDAFGLLYQLFREYFNTNPGCPGRDLDDIASYMDFFFSRQIPPYIVQEVDSFYFNGEWIYIPTDSFLHLPRSGANTKRYF